MLADRRADCGGLDLLSLPRCHEPCERIGRVVLRHVVGVDHGRTDVGVAHEGLNVV